MQQKSQTSFTLKGRLAEDAPGLFKDLSRLFDVGQCGYLSDCYRAAAKVGALEEAPVVREDGVSYNPKPARVCSILLKECPRYPVRIYGCSFFAVLPQVRLVTVSSQFQSEVAALSTMGDITEAEPAIQNVYLSVFLDQIRHLHMTHFSDQRKRVEYEKAVAQLLEWEQLPISSEATRVLTLSKQWLKLLKPKLFRVAPDHF